MWRELFARLTFGLLFLTFLVKVNSKMLILNIVIADNLYPQLHANLILSLQRKLFRTCSVTLGFACNFLLVYYRQIFKMFLFINTTFFARSIEACGMYITNLTKNIKVQNKLLQNIHATHVPRSVCSLHT